MDASAITNLDDASKKELATFIEQEQAKAQLNARIHQYTDMCFDKCVPRAPDARFSRSEETCLVNCVDRFLDTSMFIVERLSNQSGHH